MSVVVPPLGLLVGSYGQEGLRKSKKRFINAEHIEFADVGDEAPEEFYGGR